MKIKKSNKKIKIIILIIILLILGFIGYKYITTSKDEIKVLKTIKSYDYTLKDNATELYKEKFNELDKILVNNKVDYDAYGKKISELFVIDFYTLNNKQSKNDIGGTQFVYPTIKDNFIEKARSTFYRYVELKTDERTQKLPEVSKIDSVKIENASFKYTDGTIDNNAYKVTINWSYKKDLGYETQAKLMLVKKDNKLYIVEMN